ncbi:MAG: hypothetical protein HQL41_05905 [Alphaproteobacteria bacterium]|nr:hypothetical protein [Alphaproteobacteria bacterium]
MIATDDLPRLLARACTPRPPHPRPRAGWLSLHDTNLTVWEYQVDEDGLRTGVFDPLCRHLRAHGWRVEQHPRIKRDCPILSKWHRYCRLGDLEAHLEMAGRTIKFDMYQNVANVQNGQGGEYDFDRLDRMPTELRQRCLGSLFLLTRWLHTRHGYTLPEPNPRIGRGHMTATQYVTKKYHRPPPEGASGYCRTKDGGLLKQGAPAWVLDRRTGRWLSCRTFYIANSSWCAVTGRYGVLTQFACDFAIEPPGKRPGRRHCPDSQRRLRLEEEIAKAVGALNFDRAALLLDLAFGQEPLWGPLFRLKSVKSEMWWRPLAGGYTADTVEAGLFTWSEAHRYGGRHGNDVEIVPVNPPLKQKAA